MRTFTRVTLSALLIALALASVADADTGTIYTYDYTGNPFGLATAPYTTADFISASFTLPFLIDGIGGDLTGQVLSVTMSDGAQTLTEANATLSLQVFGPAGAIHWGGGTFGTWSLRLATPTGFIQTSNFAGSGRDFASLGTGFGFLSWGGLPGPPETHGQPGTWTVTSAIPVPVDVKPGSCPNPLNVGSNGVLPVAILGTATFDVTQVDISTVTLEGVPPVRSGLEDLATPFTPFIGKTEATDCTGQGPDGFLDVTLNFDTRSVVSALGAVTDGQALVLHLTGKLLPQFGGTVIKGEDAVVILKK